MKYWFIFLLVLLFYTTKAQTCLHTGLSRKFDYKVIYKSVQTKGMGSFKKSIITVYVISKRTKTTVQKINLTADLLFETAFKDCNAVRSYITGKNQKSEVLDYDAGDLIIADLNFDGKEDIAVKYDSGGNGGPIYNYYLQYAGGHFIKDRYLSDNIHPFPSYINNKNKILVTITHASVMKQGETTYQYNIANRKWHMIRHILIN